MQVEYGSLSSSPVVHICRSGDRKGSGMATVWKRWLSMFNVHGWNILVWWGDFSTPPVQESLMWSRSFACVLIWMIMAQCVVLFSTRRPKPSFLLNGFLHHQLVNWSLQFFGQGFFAAFGHSCWILLCLLRYHATRSKTYVYESYKLYVFFDGKEVMMMFPDGGSQLQAGFPL